MFGSIDGKVNIRLAVNTKGDQGHLYLAVKLRNLSIYFFHDKKKVKLHQVKAN